MNLKSDHLAHLQRRHKTLKEEISEALTHTSPVESELSQNLPT